MYNVCIIKCKEMGKIYAIFEIRLVLGLHVFFPNEVKEKGKKVTSQLVIFDLHVRVSLIINNGQSQYL